MSGIDILVLFLIAAALGASIGKIIYDKRQGKCCGNCQNCSGCRKKREL